MKVPVLHQILYVSKSVSIFDKQKLEELLRLSKTRNKLNGITGYLYYEKGYFLQYIEGYNKKDIYNLLNILLKDKRHNILNWLIKDSTRIRRFSDWSMRCIRIQELRSLGLEGTIIDCMESLANKKDLSFSEDYRIWLTMDTISKQKKFFDTQI